MDFEFFPFTEILDLGLDMFKPKPLAVPTPTPNPLDEMAREIDNDIIKRMIEEAIAREKERRDRQVQPYKIQPWVNPNPWVIPNPYDQPYVPNTNPYDQPFKLPYVGDPLPHQQPYVGDVPYYYDYYTTNDSTTNIQKILKTFTDTGVMLQTPVKSSSDNGVMWKTSTNFTLKEEPKYEMAYVNY